MFKKGDKVKFVGGGDRIPEYFSDSAGIPREMIAHGSTALGDVYAKEYAEIVDKYKDFYIVQWMDKWGTVMKLGFEEKSLILISNNKSNMNLLEKATLVFKSEPEKSFRKAGVTNGDDALTDEGVKVFLGWLLRKHGAEFKKDVVDSILEEEKK